MRISGNTKVHDLLEHHPFLEDFLARFNRKFEMLKRGVPRLRRVSVSSWCDVAAAAEALERQYIFSWKPNPAQLVGNYSPERIRAEITETLDVAQGCVLEMIMKDTHTVENHPERLSTWVDIAQELSQDR